MNGKQFTSRFLVLVIIAALCTSLVAQSVSAQTPANQTGQALKIPDVYVDLTTLGRQLGYSDEQIKSIDLKTQLQLMREYPTQAELGPDGSYHVVPTIENKANFTEPVFNLTSISQKTNSDGSISQQYTVSGTGSGKAAIIIAIWNYYQQELPAFGSGEYDQFYNHVVNSGKYDYWHTLTNEEATRYYIWAWITWACSEYESVDVFMEGHGARIFSSITIYCSAYASWDVQTGIPGIINYFNFFTPDTIMYGYSSNYDYSSLRMGVFHFCYSWGDTYNLGFEMPFCTYDYPPKTHSSGFIGPQDVVYYSPDFVREWGDRWLYWGWDSWSAYSDSIWAQPHQDTNPLLYTDHNGNVYA
ncbi:MAG: hypothetical protein WC203_07495 [Candidatus Bathyarchaeia archaeon]|nr:hypothetical protein [Thermoproteota archaeon]NLD66321.1 hypothetical protein [Thermoproteota archaeon]